MEEQILQKRFLAFLRGEKISLSEDKELKNMLLSLDKLSCQKSFPNQERMWEQIYAQITTTRKRSFSLRWMAAAITLPIIVGGIILYLFQTKQAEIVPTFTEISRNQVQLFLSGNRSIYVQQIAKDSVLHEKEAGIWFDTTNLMIYTPQETTEEELVYNTLHVPRCCEYHMVLSDGTEVWLNSESELRYPMRFIDDERRVFLKGEAYFQVAKNADKPFRVEAQGLEVEALGTAFNVNVYQNAGKMSTTLLSGSVKVTDLSSAQTCILKPGEQALLRDWELSTIQVNAQEVISWKDGRFVFSNMTMEEIAKQLERWYDVQIEFQEANLRYYRFTGVIKRYHELKQLIEMMKETTDIKFRLEDQKITIYQAKEKRQSL